MAVEYDRVNFRNRVVQYPRSYTEETDAGGGITHTPHTGNVIQEGVLPNEENMNRMDKGIADCAEAINDLLQRIQDILTTLNELNTRIGNNERGIAYIQNVDEMQSANIAYVAEAHNKLVEDVEALETNYNAYIARRDNPHNVTKGQVGLSEVPNVSTNNQTPTYTKATSEQNLSSGEKLSVAMGKIARDLETLLNHLKDFENPHKVTKKQIGLEDVPNVSTNNQTPTYGEATGDFKLISGETLATAMGKIQLGMKTLSQHAADFNNPHRVDYFETVQEAFEIYATEPDTIGVFRGNGDTALTVNGISRNGQYIDIGYTPSRVVIFILGDSIDGGMSELQLVKLEEAAILRRLTGCCAIAPGLNYYHSGCGASYRTATPQALLGQNHGGAAIYSTGFVVQRGNTNGMYNLNFSGVSYMYHAWR
ncbi:MAG: hypothetical protein IJ234_08670 [Clostridia bacterium]|nr:hypothetical protein [Clostridia bacterium]